MSSKFAHVCKVYLLHFLSLSICGSLGCFHILAIMNNATMNTGCNYLFEILISIFLNIQMVPNLGGSAYGFRLSVVRTLCALSFKF
jgi:hypothetical protein